MTDLTSVGRAVQHFRLKAGLSVTELSQKAGIGYDSICGFEYGKVNPPLTRLNRLCEALNVDMGVLMTFADQVDRLRALYGTKLREGED